PDAICGIFFVQVRTPDNILVDKRDGPVLDQVKAISVIPKHVLDDFFIHLVNQNQLIDASRTEQSIIELFLVVDSDDDQLHLFLEVLERLEQLRLVMCPIKIIQDDSVRLEDIEGLEQGRVVELAQVCDADPERPQPHQFYDRAGKRGLAGP